jgi:CRP/FNR family transcriptional regulator
MNGSVIRSMAGEEKDAHYTKYPTRLLYLPGGAERLAELGAMRHFKKDAVIAQQDEIPKYCYVVVSGRLISFEYSDRGNQRVYNFLEKSAVILDANLLMNTPAPVAFRAATPTDLACIDRPTLLKAMVEDPAVSFDIIRSISIKFLSAMDQVRESGAHNASWKIANLLLIFADQYGVPYEGRILIRHQLSQQVISDLLGLNRITTVNIVKTLMGMGLIERINGYYCIRDVEKLKLHLEYSV